MSRESVRKHRVNAGRRSRHYEAPMPPEPAGDPLVGKSFHTFRKAEDGCTLVLHQGTITSKVPESDLYLVQYYDWFVGAVASEELLPATAMVGWRFYGSDAEMRGEYEYGFLGERDKRHVEGRCGGAK